MARRFIWLLYLLLGAAPAAAQDRIDQLFEDYLARENIPGAVLVVLRDDRLVIQRQWGVTSRRTGTPMPRNAVQPIYSVSKHFTAAAILRLVEQGRVELDASVGLYLPQWFADQPSLRVSRLLRHTSGLANFTGLAECPRARTGRRRARRIDGGDDGFHRPGAAAALRLASVTLIPTAITRRLL